jgi:DNA-binding CsgD family transcriptional regulator
MLPALLEQIETALGSGPRRRIQAATPLTELELAVLRLLPSRLSTREIGRQLYVSPNTVRSHIQAIYRKLEVTTRAGGRPRARAGLDISGDADGPVVTWHPLDPLSLQRRWVAT